MKTNQVVQGENFPHHKEGEGGHLDFDSAPLANRMIGLTDIFLVQNNEQKYKLKNEDLNRVNMI